MSILGIGWGQTRLQAGGGITVFHLCCLTSYSILAISSPSEFLVQFQLPFLLMVFRVFMIFYLFIYFSSGKTNKLIL